MRSEALIQIIDKLRECGQLADDAQLNFIKCLLDMAMIEAMNEMDRPFGYVRNDRHRPD